MPTTDIKKGSFADVLASAARGAINDDATSEMKGLVAELQQVQRLRGGTPKGKITVELTMELNKNGGFEIDSDVKVRHPAGIKNRAYMFPQSDGSLGEEDQRSGQGKLDLGEVRDVSTASMSGVKSIADHRMSAANDRS